MEQEKGIFAGKLYELEQQYGRMQSSLHLCQQQDHEKIRQEIQKLRDEYKEYEILLQKSVEASRSPAIAALARVQLEYCQSTGELLKREMPAYLHSETSSPARDRAEAMTLYAEYAIDLAKQAMRYALLASLSAMDMQMDCDEREELDNE